MEQISPSSGHNPWLRPAVPYGQTGRSHSGISLGEDARSRIDNARNLARQIAMMLPPGFNRVLPRGYTLEGGALRMLKLRPFPSNTHLYGLHSSWGADETEAFAKDLNDGWLIELAAYMRWQLRKQEDCNVGFQSELRHLREKLEQ